MKVTLFKKNPKVYTCNSYLICGNWNALDDVNTLIDTGTDDFIFTELQHISTGLGKKRVEQIILTHEHFDHCAGLHHFIEQYHPTVIALSQSLAITQKAFDGQRIRVGDRDAEIILTPGHSSDSICVYVPEEKTLFSGDTPLSIKTPGGTYTKDYLKSLERLLALDISIIYSGHDYPVMKNGSQIIEMTYKNVFNSEIM